MAKCDCSEDKHLKVSLPTEDKVLLPILSTSDYLEHMVTREINPVLLFTGLQNPSAHAEACEGYDIDAGKYGR